MQKVLDLGYYIYKKKFEIFRKKVESSKCLNRSNGKIALNVSF